MEISISNFSIQSISEIESKLFDNKYIDSITLDFNNIKWATPTPILAIGSVIKNFLYYRNANELQTIIKNLDHSNQTINYLKHIGFFDFVGLPHGNQIGGSSSKYRYIPIQKIEIKKLKQEDNNLQKSIQSKSSELANILLGSQALQDRQSLLLTSYSIRETLRNAFEHAGVDECFICAQRWNNGISEISILDEGAGIFQTLSQAYAIEEDESILFAIKPGTTRSSIFNESENLHGNSGFGLYALSEIGRSFGSFYVGSGSKLLTLKDRTSKLSNLSFSGTFVGVRVQKIPHDFNGTLQDIISEGEKDALKDGRASKASSASKFANYF